MLVDAIGASMMSTDKALLKLYSLKAATIPLSIKVINFDGSNVVRNCVLPDQTGKEYHLLFEGELYILSLHGQLGQNTERFNHKQKLILSDPTFQIESDQLNRQQRLDSTIPCGNHVVPLHTQQERLAHLYPSMHGRFYELDQVERPVT